MSKWNTDTILLFTLYGKPRVSSKKGINKICKGNVLFYKYVHIMIRLQMKKNVFSRILKKIMYSKISKFLISFLRRHLSAGYIIQEGGANHNQHPFSNPFLYSIFFVYCIIQFDIRDLATY